jgi:hypothetical protein
VSQIVKVVAITDRPSEYETLVDLGTYRVIVRWPDGDRDRGMAIARRVAGALQDLEAYLEGGRRRPLVAIARETVLAEVVRLARDLVAPFVAPAEPGEYIGPMCLGCGLDVEEHLYAAPGVCTTCDVRRHIAALDAVEERA